jgi:hypothetical protein
MPVDFVANTIRNVAAQSHSPIPIEQIDQAKPAGVRAVRRRGRAGMRSP